MIVDNTLDTFGGDASDSLGLDPLGEVVNNDDDELLLSGCFGEAGRGCHCSIEHVNWNLVCIR